MSNSGSSTGSLILEPPSTGEVRRRARKRDWNREQLGGHHAAMLQMNIQIKDESERFTLFGKELILPEIDAEMRDKITDGPLFAERLDKLALRLDQHEMSVEELARRYATDVDSGLSGTQVEERLKRRGYNEIRTSAARSRVARLSDFVFASTNALTLICMILLVVGYMLQASREVSKLWLLLPLGLVMVWSSIASFFRATNSNRLRSFAKEYLGLTQNTVRVLREGREQRVRARGLVPGDICLLGAGEVVPADMRILSGKVFVDEKILTGIRGEVRKEAKMADGKEKGISSGFESSNILFLGTEVVSGACRGLVFYCGNSATIAKLGNQMYQYERHNSRLSRDLTFFHTLILGFAALLAVLIGLIGQWSVTGVSSADTVQQAGSVTVISVAGIILCAAPLLFNVILVLGLSMFESKFLQAKGVFISQTDFINSIAILGVVALGSETLLLDQDKRAVSGIDLAANVSLERFAEALANSSTISDSPLQEDVLINNFFRARGVRVVPTGSDAGRNFFIRVCQIHLFTDSETERAKPFIAQGDSVVCVRDEDQNFIGLVAISNPVNPKTRKAVALFNRMNIRLVPLFHSAEEATLRSLLARAGVLQLSEDEDEFFDPMSSSGGHSSLARSCISEAAEKIELIQGAQLGTMREEELNSFLETNRKATDVRGFFNVSFSQKLRVVRAMKKSSRTTVAFVGGLDLDAPALRAAHLGISVSWGGLAARVSDVRVSRADALLAVAESVAACRTCVANLRKIFMHMIAQVIPRMAPLLASLAFAYPLPLSVELIVVGSLLIDFPICAALLFEKPEFDLLSRSPRKDPIVSQRMLLVSLSFLGVFGALSGFLGFTQVLSDYGFSPNGLLGFDRAAYVLFVNNTTDDLLEPGLPSTVGSVMDLTKSSLSNMHLCGRVGDTLSLTLFGLSQVPQTERCNGPLFTLDRFNQYCYSLSGNLTYSTSTQAVVRLFQQQKALAGVIFARDPDAQGTPVCGLPDLDGVYVPHGFYTISSQPLVDRAMQNYPCATGETLSPANGLSICFTNDALWYGQTVYFASAAFFAILSAVVILRTELFSFFHVGLVHGNWLLLLAALTSLACVLLLIYVPLFNSWFGTRPIEISNLFTSAMPFFIIAFVLDETRKRYMRKNTRVGRWLLKRTMW